MKRGEVWLVNLDPTTGAEIKKTRPAVIVSHDALTRLPLRIVVPITTWQENFSQADWHIRITADKTNGLDMTSSADTFQVRSVSEGRLVKKLGALGDEEMAKIEVGLSLVLGLKN
jgi:mRNA interferase MazF